VADACRLQGVRHGAGFQSLTRGSARVDTNRQGRDVRLGLRREIHDAWYLRHLGLNLCGQLPQGLQVIAENLHGDVGPCAREHMVDAVRDRLTDGHVRAWQERYLLAELLEHGLSRAVLYLQAHVDLR
jgi:hypothetical protein